jgi:hypothetical protein
MAMAPHVVWNEVQEGQRRCVQIKGMPMKKCITLLLTLFLSTAFANNALAEGAGLNINLSNFDLRVEYNDNVTDEISGMEYIRNPDGLLFDLIVLIQTNKDFLFKSNKRIRAEIDSYNRYILISIQEPEYKEVLHLENIESLDKNSLLKGLCEASGIAACDCKEKFDATYIYRSNMPLNKASADLIEFGVFPGNNKRIYALTSNWKSASPKSKHPMFTKIDIVRQSIYGYFDALNE